MKQLLERWQTLQPREKILVASATVLAAAFIYYQLLYLPLVESIAKSRAEIANQQSLIVWMKQQINVISAARRQTSNSNTSSLPLLPLTEQSLNNDKFQQYNTSIGLVEKNKVKVSFKEAPFIDFFNWLKAFTEKNNTTVVSASLIKEDKPGIISGSVVISR